MSSSTRASTPPAGRRHGTDQRHPVSSSTRASTSRSRRLELGANSYEVLVPRSPMGACIHAPWPWPRGDQKMRERERQTATKPTYYIRGIEITPQTGLGRFGGAGGGLGSDFEHHHHVVHMGLGRARWHGTQGLPPPFRRPLCPSCRAGFAPIPTKSGASRASGLICGSW